MNRLPERTQDKIELIKRLQAQVGFDLRVAAPAIIESVDFDKQTCTAQLAIREQLNFDGVLEWVEIPLLLDVPFFVYSGGGYCVTLPIKPGDDCLIVFGDMCIDAWWQSGGIQNQVERRRHDLSDGFAIVGFKSQPAVVKNYSPNTLQMRNEAGNAFIEIDGSNINIKGAMINIEAGGNVSIKTNGGLGISAEGGADMTASGGATFNGGITIDGHKFLSHTHGGVQNGSGNTQGVS